MNSLFSLLIPKGFHIYRKIMCERYSTPSGSHFPEMILAITIGPILGRGGCLIVMILGSTLGHSILLIFIEIGSFQGGIDEFCFSVVIIF